MDVLQNSRSESKGSAAPRRNPDPSGPSVASPLATYMVALHVYQRRQTQTGRTALFLSYRRWIGAFLDDEGEADRAANNFLIALRNQPPESQEMGAVA